MTRASTKVERLVRLNRFREDVATGHVQRAVARRNEAAQSHELAEAIVDAIGEWKTGHLDGAPDLGLYAAVLGIEARAVDQADREQAVLAECTGRADATRRQLHDARSATRASDRRHQRLADAASVAEEKREFDRNTEVWLANRGNQP
jgi:hypothetical protein